MELTLQVGTIGGLGLQCGPDDLSDAFILKRSGSHSAQLIEQALKAELDKAFALLPDGGVLRVHARGDGGVGIALGTSEDDLGALD